MSQHTDVIEAGLRRHALRPASTVGRMIGYHFGWLDPEGRATRGNAGKLLRSSLCLWACRACGGSIEAALPAAVAIELVHNFTLIHDDIQDGDRLRRGRPSVWSIWGEAQAINAGDALHALAFNVLSEGANDRERAATISGLISRALLQVIDGQGLDLSLEGRPSTSPLSYLRLIRLKTGALIGAAMEAGAVSGGVPSETARAFRRAGVLLGVAFQLRDDWLGVWGDAAETGKSTESDLSRHKLTYPVIAAYAAAAPAQRAALARLYAEAVTEIGGGDARPAPRAGRGRPDGPSRAPTRRQGCCGPGHLWTPFIRSQGVFICRGLHRRPKHMNT